MKSKRGDQHRYGQHYTPAEVARLLAAFAIREPSDTVFDPACGDGRLLRQALLVKKSLDPARRKRGAVADETLARQVFGIDRSAVAVRLAAQTGAQVARADFFDLAPEARAPLHLPAQFDALIGNPPYIRQEIMGERDKRRIEERLRSDRKHMPEVFWPQWSRRSDIYVYFFARSVCFLKRGGRLAFLTASSWLDAGYGLALREFLLRNFRIHAVIESAIESFFADASINTAVTVISRADGEESLSDNSVRFVRLNAPLAEIFGCSGASEQAVEFARSVESTPSNASDERYSLRLIAQSDLAAQSGWGKYLRAADVFFCVSDRSARLRSLSSVARVRFGLKTGANRFFYVTRSAQDAASKDGGASLTELGRVASIRRGLTTGANEFFYLKPQAALDGRRGRRLLWVEDGSGARRQIESAFLSPVIFSLKEMPGIMLEGDQSSRLLFNCAEAREGLAGTRALEYIRSGERSGYHLRPTCSSRERWYSVLRSAEPAPLIFPSKVGERWLVALNRARVFEDKKLYGIFPSDPATTLTLAALLNSTWARYYAEVTCRQMTGAQAIADIDVAVAEQIMIPDPRALPQSLRRNLESALLQIARRRVLSVFEEVTKPDRRRLDSWTLAAIGFADRAEREAVLDRLYEAVTALVRERLNKSKS